MFSWITGPRITNVIEDLQPESNYESTFIDVPETPAHQFAVKAFKHALFGTPAPEGADNNSKAERKAKLEVANARIVEIPAPKEDTPPLSPSKQPGGILMTPGTASKGRKTVSFGSQVVDNEGKHVSAGKSGIPNDCPGKFPSPWTPGTQLKLDVASDKRPRTRLTEALLDARTTTQPKSGQKPKARDDSDITMDLGAPRSDSGKYWKEQYENYAQRSEKEMRKVIAKQQLAKKFAMKKDAEVTELATKLEQERKQFGQRERDLEQHNKDMDERLRQAMVNNASAAIEVAGLKARVVTLEQSISGLSSDVHQDKFSFNIFEDSNRGPSAPPLEGKSKSDPPFALSPSKASSGKENSSPKSRRHRRQIVPTTSKDPISLARLGTAQGEASIILAKSPRALTQPTLAASEQALASLIAEQPYKSPFNARKTEPNLRNPVPVSPIAANLSSPLPIPSPDPWLDMEGSSIQGMDKMALPVSSGVLYSRPGWSPPHKLPRVSKSASHARSPDRPATSRQKEVSAVSKTAKTMGKQDVHPEQITQKFEAVKEKPGANVENTTNSISNHHDVEPSKPAVVNKSIPASHQPPTDPKFDISKITAHHAEGSAQVKRDRAEIVPLDRKELAKQRLEERRKLRKNTPV